MALGLDRNKRTHYDNRIADARDHVKSSLCKTERKQIEDPASNVNCEEAVRYAKHLAAFVDLPVLRATRFTRYPSGRVSQLSRQEVRDAHEATGIEDSAENAK